jgi:hypothetical protein
MGTIDVRSFMWLAKLFATRGWSNPRPVEIGEAISGVALLEALQIPRGDVEALIVNHRTLPVEACALRPGDRVALVPPGVPGPHRLLLGLHAPGGQGADGGPAQTNADKPNH